MYVQYTTACAGLLAIIATPLIPISIANNAKAVLIAQSSLFGDYSWPLDDEEGLICIKSQPRGPTGALAPTRAMRDF
jgi:hypothetical protein